MKPRLPNRAESKECEGITIGAADRGGLVRVLSEAVRERNGETHDPMLYAALISALERLSLDLRASGAKPENVLRAKRVMGFVIDRVLGARGRGDAEVAVV
jgi:hypothetical protein